MRGVTPSLFMSLTLVSVIFYIFVYDNTDQTRQMILAVFFFLKEKKFNAKLDGLPMQQLSNRNYNYVLKEIGLGILL